MRKLLALWLLLAPSLALAQPVQTLPVPGQVTPLTVSTTGTTAQITATLTGAVGRWTYICGFVLTSAGTTTAALGNATVAGTVSGTMNFTYSFVSSGQGLLGVAFPGCITSSAPGTNIVITLPAGGAGTTVAISAWGYLN
jgi:hypothetical protein